mgnify:FL=1
MTDSPGIIAASQDDSLLRCDRCEEPEPNGERDGVFEYLCDACFLHHPRNRNRPPRRLIRCKRCTCLVAVREGQDRPVQLPDGSTEFRCQDCCQEEQLAANPYLPEEIEPVAEVSLDINLYFAIRSLCNDLIRMNASLVLMQELADRPPIPGEVLIAEFATKASVIDASIGRCRENMAAIRARK